MHLFDVVFDSATSLADCGQIQRLHALDHHALVHLILFLVVVEVLGVGDLLDLGVAALAVVHYFVVRHVRVRGLDIFIILTSFWRFYIRI